MADIKYMLAPGTVRFANNEYGHMAHGEWNHRPRREINNERIPSMDPNLRQQAIAVGAIVAAAGPCGGGTGKSGSSGDVTSLSGGDCVCSGTAEWFPEWDQAAEADYGCFFCFG